MRITTLAPCLVSAGLLVACGSSTTTSPDDGDASGDAVDITDASFTDRDGTCTSRIGSYAANVTDIGRSMDFTASVVIRADGSDCALTSNGIPNHDFNDGGAFATAVAEVTESFSLAGSPVAAAEPTPLSLTYDNGVFLDGVKLDLLVGGDRVRGGRLSDLRAVHRRRRDRATRRVGLDAADGRAAVAGR